MFANIIPVRELSWFPVFNSASQLNTFLSGDCNIQKKEHKKLEKYKGLKEGNGEVDESQSLSGASGHWSALCCDPQTGTLAFTYPRNNLTDFSLRKHRGTNKTMSKTIRLLVRNPSLNTWLFNLDGKNMFSLYCNYVFFAQIVCVRKIHCQKVQIQELIYQQNTPHLTAVRYSLHWICTFAFKALRIFYPYSNLKAHRGNLSYTVCTNIFSKNKLIKAIKC